MKLNIEYLKEVLATKGWTERQFALKTGLSPATISRILGGKRGAGAKTIGAIRKALPGEPLDKLFFFGLTVTTCDNSQQTKCYVDYRQQN